MTDHRAEEDLLGPELRALLSTLPKELAPERDLTEEIAAQSRGAEIGCVDCKKILADGINRGLAPFRERRAEIAERPGYIEEVLADGAERAQAVARDTIAEVKDKMGLP